MSLKNIPPGAGIVLFKEVIDTNGIPGLKVLALVQNNKYDIPKGGIDPGETAFEAAVRETLEEAGIDDLDFRWGLKSFVNEKLTFFVAVTSQEPTIRPNPHTGIIEHDYAKWIKIEDFIKNTKKFLIPGVEWGYKVATKV